MSFVLQQEQIGGYHAVKQGRACAAGQMHPVLIHVNLMGYVIMMLPRIFGVKVVQIRPGKTQHVSSYV
jgi:hypothetical protein